MIRTGMITQIQQRSVRRRTLVLLAALAVTLAAIATPLAGTADAGGLRGGVILANGAVTSDLDIDGSKLGSGTDGVPVVGDSGENTFQTTGRKRGVAAGTTAER